VLAEALFYFPFLAPMIYLTHTTTGRLLSHLRKLTRADESLLSRPPFLTPLDEVPWDARVWSCLAKIAAPNAFAGATQLDNADTGEIDLLDFDRPSRSALEGDELLRRRIRRRLVTLASVIEKVEALAELPPPHPTRFPSPRRRTRDPNS
jgi:hypothetical protein